MDDCINATIKEYLLTFGVILVESFGASYKNISRQRCHEVVAHVNPRLQRLVNVTLVLLAQEVLEPPVEIHSLEVIVETLQLVHCNGSDIRRWAAWMLLFHVVLNALQP